MYRSFDFSHVGTLCAALNDNPTQEQMDAQGNEEHLEKQQKFLKPIKYILAPIIAPIRVHPKA